MGMAALRADHQSRTPIRLGTVSDAD